MNPPTSTPPADAAASTETATHGAEADSVVLEEEIDPNYVPSESEVIEYAIWLGMDLENDKDLYWIAREGLMAPLPKSWKPCKMVSTGELYYFNFSNGESTWDHPCDDYYKRLFEEEKKKKEIVLKESGDQKRTKAKQDVEQLLGKSDKKSKKKKSALGAPIGPGTGNVFEKAALPGLGPVTSIERKPLPGISAVEKMEFKASTASPMSSFSSSATADETKSQPSTTPTPMRASAKSKLLAAVSAPSHSIDTDYGPDSDSEAKQQQSAKPESDEKHSEIGRDTEETRPWIAEKHASPKVASRSVQEDPLKLPANAQSPEYHHHSSERKAVVGESVLDLQRPQVLSRIASHGADSNSTNQVSRKEHESVLDQLYELQKLNQSLRSSSEELSKQLSSAEQEASTQRSRAQQLEEQLQDCENRRNSLRQTASDLQKRLTEAQEAEEMALKKERDLRERTRLLDADIDTLEKEKRSLKSANNELTDRLEVLSRADKPTNANMGRENDQQRIAELELALQQSRRSAADLSTNLNAEMLVLHGKLKAAQQLITELELKSSTSVVAPVSDQHNMKVLSEDAQKTINNLNNQLQISRKEHEMLNLSIEKEKQQSLSIQNELKEQEASFKRKLDSVSMERDAAKLQLPKITAEATLAKSEAENLRSSVDQLKEVIRQMEMDMQVKDSALKLAQAGDGDLRKRITYLETEASSLRQQIGELQVSSAAASSPDEITAFNPVEEELHNHFDSMRTNYEAEISTQRGRASQLENDKAALVAQISRQDTELRHAKAELNRLASVEDSGRQRETQCLLLEKQLENIEARLLEVQQSEATALNEAQEAVKALAKSTAKILQIEQAAMEQDAIFRGTVDAEREAYSKLQNEYMEIQTNLQREKDKLLQMEKESKNWKNEIIELQSNLQLEKDKVLQMEREIKYSKDEVVELQSNLQREKDKVLQMERECKNSRDEIVALKLSAESLKFTASHSTILSSSHSIVNSNHTSESRAMQTDEEVSAVNPVKNENERLLSERVEEFKVANGQLGDQLSTAQATIKLKDEELIALRKQVADMRESVQRATDDAQQKQTLLNTMMTTGGNTDSTLKSEILKLQQQQISLNETVFSLTSQLEQAELRKTILCREHETATELYQKNIIEMRQQMEANAGECLILKQKLVHAVTECDILKRQIAGLESDCETYRLKWIESETQMNDLRRDKMRVLELEQLLKRSSDESESVKVEKAETILLLNKKLESANQTISSFSERIKQLELESKIQPIGVPSSTSSGDKDEGTNQPSTMLLELGATVAQQQHAMRRLEEQLRQAESRITSLHYSGGTFTSTENFQAVPQQQQQQQQQLPPQQYYQNQLEMIWNPSQQLYLPQFSSQSPPRAVASSIPTMQKVNIEDKAPSSPVQTSARNSMQPNVADTPFTPEAASLLSTQSPYPRFEGANNAKVYYNSHDQHAIQNIISNDGRRHSVKFSDTEDFNLYGRRSQPDKMERHDSRYATDRKWKSYGELESLVSDDAIDMDVLRGKKGNISNHKARNSRVAWEYQSETDASESPVSIIERVKNNDSVFQYVQYMSRNLQQIADRLHLTSKPHDANVKHSSRGSDHPRSTVLVANLLLSGKDFEIAERSKASLLKKLLNDARLRVAAEQTFLDEAGELLNDVKHNLLLDQKHVAELKDRWKQQRNSGLGTVMPAAAINERTISLNDAVSRLRTVLDALRKRLRKIQKLRQLTDCVESVLEQQHVDLNAQRPLFQYMRKLVLDLESQLLESILNSTFEDENVIAKRVKIERRVESGNGYSPRKESKISPHKVSSNRRSYAEKDNLFEDLVSHDELADLESDEGQWLKKGKVKQQRGYSNIPIADRQQNNMQPTRLPISNAHPSEVRISTTDNNFVTSLSSQALPTNKAAEHKQQLLRQQIVNISSRQHESKDAYDKHAGWLDNLMREIGTMGRVSVDKQTPVHSNSKVYSSAGLFADGIREDTTKKETFDL